MSPHPVPVYSRSAVRRVLVSARVLKIVRPLVCAASLLLGASLGRASTGQYEKFELSFAYTTYSNPYDPAIVDVEAVFTAPSGKKQTVPGFFYQNYTRSGGVT